MAIGVGIDFTPPFPNEMLCLRKIIGVEKLLRHSGRSSGGHMRRTGIVIGGPKPYSAIVTAKSSGAPDPNNSHRPASISSSVALASGVALR